MIRRVAEAIVLQTWARGETDRVVELILESGELLRAIAPAAARSSQRFGGALMPASRVRARWHRRRESMPGLLEEARLDRAPPVPDPLERFYVTAHLLELVRTFAREGSEDPRLFRLLDASLERLCSRDPVAPLARYFEAWVLRLAGVLPEPSTCAACGTTLAGQPGGVAPEKGFFCAQHVPAGARRLSARALEWLALTRGARPAELPALGKTDDAQLARALHGLLHAFTERPLTAWTALERLGSDARAREERDSGDGP